MGLLDLFITFHDMRVGRSDHTTMYRRRESDTTDDVPARRMPLTLKYFAEVTNSMITAIFKIYAKSNIQSFP